MFHPAHTVCSAQYIYEKYRTKRIECLTFKFKESLLIISSRSINLLESEKVERQQRDVNDISFDSILAQPGPGGYNEEFDTGKPNAIC